MARGRKMYEFIALILICVAIGSFGQIYMKKGLMNLGGIDLKEILTTKIFSTVFEKNVFTGISLYVIATLLWLVILSKAELSFAYPMIALGYVITAFLARIYFNENITLVRWFGILLILGGVFLTSRS
jgi:drug/metabolite transporter (DMT)-like permease